MKGKNATRRALVMSVLSLVLCLSMLIGTTFAWFTDSVTSANNIIKAGNLDVELLYKDNAGDAWLDASQGKIFNYQLWEPGYTEVKYIQVANVGNLALRYRLSIDPDVDFVDGEVNLADVIEVRILSAAEAAGKTRAEILAIEPVGTLTSLMAATKATATGILLPDPAKQASSVTLPTEDAAIAVVGSVEYCIVLHMQEEAGNEYQNLSVGEGFSVQLLATQYTYENDAFDHLYDDDAKYPAVGSGTLNGISGGVNIQVRNGEGYKVGALTLPAGAVADPAKPIEVRFDESQYVGNFTVASGMETHVVDITATNVKAGNTVSIWGYIRIAAGLDPATVSLYHYDTLIDSNYDPNTGYVTFETTEFSPFTVVFDAESEYVPEDTTEQNLPVAVVKAMPEYVNTELPWGNFGGWSPTEGLDSKLECAYEFSCKDTAEEAKESPYANWYCDFYVKVDCDLGENEIFLGGNYGSFGWIGFHNGDVTLKANEELPLLGSVTTNPWTYADIANFVGTFTCGVGDVDNALSGATFTVMLRLTNPDNESEFYNVATISYTFE